MDVKKCEKDVGCEVPTVDKKTENGPNGGKEVYVNQNNSAFHTKKPGFHKKQNKVNTEMTDGNLSNLPGSSEAVKGKTHTGKEIKPDKSAGAVGEETVTGIDCGVTERTDSNFDSASVGSGSNTITRNEGHERVINLCVRGEWILLDQHLRNIKRGHPSLARPEQVSKHFFLR